MAEQEFIINTTSHTITITPPNDGTINGSPTATLNPGERLILIRGEGKQWHTEGVPPLEIIENISPRFELRLTGHTTVKRVENLRMGALAIHTPPGETFMDGTSTYWLDFRRFVYIMRTSEGKWRVFPSTLTLA